MLIRSIPIPCGASIPLDPAVTRSEAGGSDGSYLGATWELPGSYLGATWELPGSYLGATWELPGSYLGATWEQRAASWELPGSYLGATWELPGSYPGATRELPGTYLGATWELPGSYLGATWELPGSYLGATWELPGSYLGAEGSLLVEVSAPEDAVLARRDDALALDANATWPTGQLADHMTVLVVCPLHLRRVDADLRRASTQAAEPLIIIIIIIIIAEMAVFNVADYLIEERCR